MKNYEKIVCEVCGGTELIERNGKLVCRSCDTSYDRIAEKANDAWVQRITRLDRAEAELRKTPPHFEKAEDAFSELIKQYPTWSAGYWGLVRAKFGIKYVRDNASEKVIPTCYKSAGYSDFQGDKDFLKALEYAENDEIKNKYIKEAERIASVCEEWRNKARNISYDIFISFKDNENGIKTEDSGEMQNLYAFLTEQGYKVFYSPISMREFVGSNYYDAYIYNALEKAQIMILYGSKAEYFTSSWIENEWMRYIYLIGKGLKDKESLLPCFRGFNPSQELPRQLRDIQGVDFSDKTCYITLLSQIEKIFKNNKKRKGLPRALVESGKIGKKKSEVRNQLEIIEIGEKSIKRKANLPQSSVTIRELASAAIGIYTPSVIKAYDMGKIALQEQSYSEAKMFFEECLKEDKTYGKAWVGLIASKLKDAEIFNNVLKDEPLTLSQENKCGLMACFADMQNAIEYSEETVTAERVLHIACKALWDDYSLPQNVNSDYLELYKVVLQYNAPIVDGLNNYVQTHLEKLETSDDVFDGIVTALLSRTNDVEKYCDILNSSVSYYVSKNNVAGAKKWNTKLYEIDSDNCQCIIRKILFENGVLDDASYINNISQSSVMRATKALDGIICDLTAESAHTVLNWLYSVGEECYKNNISVFEILFDFLMRYKHEQREQFIENVLFNTNPIVRTGKTELFEKIINASENVDVDWHISNRIKFANSLRTDGKFDKAIKIYNSVFDLQENNFEALSGIVVSSVHYKGLVNEISWNRFPVEYWERLLSACVDQTEQSKLINEWCEKCLQYLTNLSGTFLVRIKSIACLKVFDKLITYYPECVEVDMYKQVNTMADVCLSKGLFKAAKTYYSLLLNDENTEEYIARWGILLADFKCKNTEELQVCHKFNIEHEDYKLLLLSCGDSPHILKQYTNIAEEQSENKANGETTRIKENHFKQTLQYVGLTLALVGLLFGVFAWMILGQAFRYNEFWLILPFAISVVAAIIGIIAYATRKLPLNLQEIISGNRRYIGYIVLFVFLYILFFGGGLAAIIIGCIIANEAVIPGFFGGLACWVVGGIVIFINVRTLDKSSYKVVDFQAEKEQVSTLRKINWATIAALILSVIFLIVNGLIWILPQDYEGYGDSYYYSYLDDGTIELEKYDGKISEEIVIPQSINGKTVSVIGKNLFSNQSQLKNVIIPDSVTEIGWCAFENCTGLKSIAFPKLLQNIGGSSFSGCTGLTNIVIPNSVKSIYGGAFEGCTGLTNVVIGNGVTNIGVEAFSGCKKLVSLTIGESVKTIGYEAFARCSSLSELYFNAKNCDDFENDYSVGWGTRSSAGIFYCSSGKTDGIRVTFGKNVERVPAKLFRGQHDSSSVYDVGLPKLYSVDFENGSICREIGAQAFRGTSLKTVKLSNKITKIADMAFDGCSSLSSINIPQGVTTIGLGAFRGNALTTISIPKSVISIGSMAFAKCRSLTIYCEVTTQPIGWSEYWNDDNRPVVWGYEG